MRSGRNKGGRARCNNKERVQQRSSKAKSEWRGDKWSVHHRAPVDTRPVVMFDGIGTGPHVPRATTFDVTKRTPYANLAVHARGRALYACVDGAAVRVTAETPDLFGLLSRASRNTRRETLLVRCPVPRAHTGPVDSSAVGTITGGLNNVDFARACLMAAQCGVKYVTVQTEMDARFSNEGYTQLFDGCDIKSHYAATWHVVDGKDVTAYLACSVMGDMSDAQFDIAYAPRDRAYGPFTRFAHEKRGQLTVVPHWSSDVFAHTCIAVRACLIDTRTVRELFFYPGVTSGHVACAYDSHNVFPPASVLQQHVFVRPPPGGGPPRELACDTDIYLALLHAAQPCGYLDECTRVVLAEHDDVCTGTYSAADLNAAFDIIP